MSRIDVRSMETRKASLPGTVKIAGVGRVPFPKGGATKISHPAHAAMFRLCPKEDCEMLYCGSRFVDAEMTRATISPQCPGCLMNKLAAALENNDTAESAAALAAYYKWKSTDKESTS
jgi:hypothetical protein